MTIPPQFLYRDVSIHPPEADRWAEKIADLIRQYVAENSKIDTCVNNLHTDWEGHHKEMFISDMIPPKKQTAALLDYLRRQVQFYRILRVTRREAYPNPAWETYVGKNH